MSMRWSMGSVRIRKRLAAISGGNYIGAERRATGGVAALSRRSSLATQHRISASCGYWRPAACRPHIKLLSDAIRLLRALPVVVSLACGNSVPRVQPHASSCAQIASPSVCPL